MILLNRFVNFFLVLTLLPFQSYAAESSILIRASGVDLIHFQAHVQAYPEVTSFSAWRIFNRLPSVAKQNLKNLLSIAQSEFLNGGVVQARQKFSELVRLSDTQDWRSAERSTFVYAHLRLAQMSTDQDEREAHLANAARWGDAEVTAELFPPPLWQSYLKIKKSRLSEALDLDLWFPEARYLLVDGRPIEILAATKIELDQLPHRFTLIYDHAESVTKIATWSEIKAWQPRPKVFVTGDCQTADWQNNPELPQSQVYFSEDCITPFGGAKAKKLIDLKPTTANMTAEWARPQSLKSDSKISGWVWAAAGVAILTAIAISQKADEKTQSGTAVDF